MVKPKLQLALKLSPNQDLLFGKWYVGSFRKLTRANESGMTHAKYCWSTGAVEFAYGGIRARIAFNKPHATRHKPHATRHTPNKQPLLSEFNGLFIWFYKRDLVQPYYHIDHGPGLTRKIAPSNDYNLTLAPLSSESQPLFEGP
ncbi:hypothetical protein M407DRAFT_30868 [Tulasnella calospora MUT 4182]|uniref:Uncharacterized protein n=1 Tax=Tulasnella calospora MUT 4182 TaxID=1051891 RepID=A0A0C3PWP5_9AGAM|nr:hypothetical protein M407DRAFT_30868 [Tulasnella calospora MUT 4182]